MFARSDIPQHSPNTASRNHKTKTQTHRKAAPLPPLTQVTRKVSSRPKAGNFAAPERDSALKQPSLEKATPLRRACSQPMAGEQRRLGTTRNVTLFTRRTTVRSASSSTNGDDAERSGADSDSVTVLLWKGRRVIVAKCDTRFPFGCMCACLHARRRYCFGRK